MGGLVIQIVVALGSLGGLAALVLVVPNWKKLRSEVTISEDAALDTRWKSMIDTQTAALLEPLSEEVRDLRARVVDLEQQVKTIRRLYRLAVDTLRAFVQYSLVLVGLLPPGVTPPPPPQIPNDIADDF